MIDSISFTELLILNCYLGAITFLIGTFIFTILIYRYGKNKKKPIAKMIFFIFSQLLVTVTISLIVWKIWVFHTDILIGIISIPSLVAEVITIPIFILFLNKCMIKSKLE